MSTYFDNLGGDNLGSIIAFPQLKKSFNQQDLITNKIDFNKEMILFSIKNDGANDLQFTIGTNTLVVKPGEPFIEHFDPFTSITITGTSLNFRAYVGGY